MADGPKQDVKLEIVDSALGYPEFFADGVDIALNPYGVALTFNVTRGERKIARVVTVRMSPQLALVMTQLLKKNLRAYEDKVGKIQLPSELYDGLKIDKEI
jgi:hypothetical protein